MYKIKQINEKEPRDKTEQYERDSKRMKDMKKSKVFKKYNIQKKAHKSKIKYNSYINIVIEINTLHWICKKLDNVEEIISELEDRIQETVKNVT